MAMAKLYADANPRYIAYYLEGNGLSGSGYEAIPPGHTITEAEYMAVMYALNSYYLAWNKELDARQEDLDTERMAATGEEEFYRVATPSDQTKRPLPPPVLVMTDNEVVAKQLSRQYHIGNDGLRKLASQIWQMTQNVEVVFKWIPRKENIAGKMLP